MMTGTRRLRLRMLERDLEAVHAGHFDVEQDEIGVEIFKGGQRLLAVGGGSGDLDGTLRFEDHAQQAAHDGRVIDQEHAHFAGGG
jgi:hypothetical protein